LTMALWRANRERQNRTDNHGATAPRPQGSWRSACRSSRLGVNTQDRSGHPGAFAALAGT
jgi:hypothetical protein